MKKAFQAMKIAHGIKKLFTSFVDALKFAWNIIKTGVIVFAKLETGEIRTAKIQSFTTIEFKKGYAKFIEILSDGSTQFRSLRLDRVVV